LIHSKEVHNNTKMTVLVVKYFTYLKHAAALDRLRVRLNVILFLQLSMMFLESKIRQKFFQYIIFSTCSATFK